jgi:CHAD domain-containing protein
MSYQLRVGEELSAGIRRVCRRQIELAIEASRSPRTDTRSPVHETRKHLKKARAALLLLSGVASRDEFARTIKKLGRVADLISGIRDAEVRFQTMRQLGHLLRIEDEGVVQTAEAFLGLELESFLAAFSDWKEEAAFGLTKARRRMKAWPTDRLTGKQLRRTVQQGYKRGRETLRKASETPTAENFHDFRKRAKELMYQLRVLQPLHLLLLQQLVSELEGVAEHLGNAHDLAFLEKRLIKHKRRGADDRTAGALSELIGLREKELQRTAAALGEKFYAERPKVFARRVSEFFEVWETTSGKAESNRQNGFHPIIAANGRPLPTASV